MRPSSLRQSFSLPVIVALAVVTAGCRTPPTVMAKGDAESVPRTDPLRDLPSRHLASPYRREDRSAVSLRERGGHAGEVRGGQSLRGERPALARRRRGARGHDGRLREVARQAVSARANTRTFVSFTVPARRTDEAPRAARTTCDHGVDADLTGRRARAIRCDVPTSTRHDSRAGLALAIFGLVAACGARTGLDASGSSTTSECPPEAPAASDPCDAPALVCQYMAPCAEIAAACSPGGVWMVGDDCCPEAPPGFGVCPACCEGRTCDYLDLREDCRDGTWQADF